MLKNIILGTILALGLAWQPAIAGDNDLITKKSSFGVAETLDRLEALFAERGIGVAARVDHTASAKRVDLELRPNQVLIFGNPKLGTPLMQSNPAIGIDLPLRVLAWEDADGNVWVAYTDPDTLRSRHEITDRDKNFAQMTKVLDGLTTAAASP
ncbi:MAG: DUF302 domain-containing protein [Alphaproteobacteria bacterium]